ncbi:MAG: primosomal protein N', partial [Chloroflexi bacterium]|nr:primosomal protein N' [Chloroflexota bacterium]
MLFAEVAVASAVNRQGQLFTYAVPDCLSGDVVAGQLVHVPFGQRKLQGIVISLTEKAPSFDAREIEAVVDTSPVLHRPQISLLLWITDYYRCSTGEVIRLFLPPGLSQQAVPVVWLKPEVSVDLGRLTAEEGSVTSLLQQRGPLSVTRIRSILHLRGLEKVLKELERKGWLSSAYVWEKTLAHPRYDRFVALAENRDSCSDGDRRSPLGPRQAAVLRYLQDSAHRGVNVGSAGESEWLPVGDVLRETDARMTTVRALENAGLVRLESREVSRSSLKARFFPLSEPPTLTLAQGLAWREIAGGLLGGEHKVYLLHGVTGSGKTEIYLRAITRAIRLQKKAIVLVPEIALTPDMLRRFAARFPGRIAVMHSRLSPGERFDEWRRIRSGEVDIVIGSRSAIFSPVPNLGLIVVDEEHEWSYKQEQRPRYHAREVAVKLGEFAGATVVLGSATPDVVTYFRATRGDYHRLELPHRVGQAQADRRYEIAPELALPPVEVVDLRQELKAGNGGIFSRSLHRSLRQAIARGDQAILFLNRRGSATLVLCRNCGHVLRCHRCTFSLVYHRAEREVG